MNDQQNFHFLDKERKQNKLPNASKVLILGIASILGACFYGLPGVVFGAIALWQDKKDQALYRSAPELYTIGSSGRPKSGRNCAIIGIALGLFIVLGMLIHYLSFISSQHG